MAEQPTRRRSVVVTRPAGQSTSMVMALQGRFDVIDLPLTEIVPPADGGEALRSALATIERYSWLVITSANGATAVLDRLDRAGAALDVGGESAPSVAAIGERTASALATAGVMVDFVPSRFEPETFADEFPDPTSEVDRVLLARAEAASEVLPVGLAAKGWLVDDVAAYRSVPTEPDADVVGAAFDADVVTFTAPSAVARFRELLGTRRCDATIASIGPVTSASARHHGFEVSIEPDQHTTEDLVSAIEKWASADS